MTHPVEHTKNPRTYWGESDKKWGLFPRKPVQSQFTGPLATNDFDQALADYDAFYRHLSKSANFDWAEPAAPKLFGYGQGMQFDPSVLEMYKGMPALDVGATYGVPAEFPGISSIVNLQKEKRKTYGS